MTSSAGFLEIEYQRYNKKYMKSKVHSTRNDEIVKEVRKHRDVDSKINFDPQAMI